MSTPCYRAVFVSDAHLGFHLAREAEFCNWLEELQCGRLYLNGDIFDGWRLRRKFRWNSFRSRIISRLEVMQRDGTSVLVIPGNHDDFLRDSIPLTNPCPVLQAFVNCPTANEFEHECLGGKKLLVTHGDLLDPVERRGRAISKLGSVLFDGVSSVVPRNLSHWIKRSSKGVFGRPNSLARRIQELAIQRGLDGAIFGHIHRPMLERRTGGFVLANCGDWVEHASFIAETAEGNLVLVDGGEQRAMTGMGAGLETVPKGG